jgi:L-ribulokinase
MAGKKLVIGVDYGTDSVRSVVVDAQSGKVLASEVHGFTRWKQGKYCNPSKNQFRQHPLDHIEGLEITVKKALKAAPKGSAEYVKGISVDTTGSTPGPVDRQGTPLALLPAFRENPNAMFVLWKDHTSVKEAEEINRTARTWGGEDFTKYIGGVYSSEWFWAKMLHVIRQDEKVRRAAYSWVENCDWIPAMLTGVSDVHTVKRSRCAAGHKAMWHRNFSGLPSQEFLSKIDPLLSGMRERLFRDTYTSDVKAGNLCAEWAARLGLSTDVAVGVGAFDAHMGAVGVGIKPFTMTKVIGTSTCDMVVVPLKEYEDKLIRGICGQVDGSVVPGMLGLEAGQSAFGDVYAWFKEVLLWPSRNLLSGAARKKLVEELDRKIIPALAEKAAKIPPGESSVVAVDWINGRRTPFANQALKGAITGINIGTDAAQLFKALVESTAFGAKKIVECFESGGVPIREVIAIGGVARKSPFAMQVLADVLNRKIRIAESEQACALGAAIFAAVASGVHRDVAAAQKCMASGIEKEFLPRPKQVAGYQTLYAKYGRAGEFIEAETLKERRGA